jgi:hypothetical protein
MARITVNLDFGGDMSANRRTGWIDMQGNTHASLDIAWPATDTPVGAIAIEVSNHGSYGVAGTVYSPAIATQPAGTDDSAFPDYITTAAKFICVTYTVTSGGTGASFTDGTGVAGNLPKLIITD